MQVPPPVFTTSNYPRQDLVDDRQLLREIAATQKQVLFCILGNIGIFILNLVVSVTHSRPLAILELILILVVFVFMVTSVYRLAKALSLMPLVYVALMFVPCISLIALVSINGKPTTRLQQAGIKVGIMGANPDAI